MRCPTCGDPADHRPAPSDERIMRFGEAAAWAEIDDARPWVAGLAHGTLRYTCAACGGSGRAVEARGPLVSCPACGAWAQAQVWHVQHATRTARSVPDDECDERRCVTSTSTQCRCRCMGLRHGSE